MPLHIAEFSGTHSSPGPLVASQTVAIGGTSVQSAAVNAFASRVRLLADSDCQVSTGVNPDASTDAVIALQAGIDHYVNVYPGDKIAVMQRTVTSGGTLEADDATVSESGSGPYHQTVISLDATPVVFADDAGNGQYAGLLLYTFPEGLIKSLGVAVNGNLTGAPSFIATFEGNVSVGTQAVSDATFAGADEDLMADAAFTQAVDDVAAVNRVVGAASAESDGTTTAVPVYLNFVVTDDAAHEAGSGSFTGTVTLTWLYLGDD